jgi:8-oxo-dGTP pyrophosphatase MutT (NUDIX family)
VALPSAPASRKEARMSEAIAISDLPLRDTARGLVFDPQGRLLLIQYEAAIDVDPARPGLRAFWFTPGGGLEQGESHEEALRRELAEEIGVADAPIGAHVARRETPLLLFRVPRFVRERYFVVRLPSPGIDTSRLAETEVDPVLDIRWWTLDALERTHEVIEPAALIGLARRVADGDAPDAPLRLA